MLELVKEVIDKELKLLLAMQGGGAIMFCMCMLFNEPSPLGEFCRDDTEG